MFHKLIKCYHDKKYEPIRNYRIRKLEKNSFETTCDRLLYVYLSFIIDILSNILLFIIIAILSIIISPIFIPYHIFHDFIPYIMLKYNHSRNNRLFNRIYLKRIINLCIEINKYELFENLINNKLNINEINLIIDNDGNNIITKLCKYKLHEDSEDIFRLLINNYIDTYHCNFKGNNALINLTNNKLNKYSSTIIKLLIENEIGIDINQINNNGKDFFIKLIKKYKINDYYIDVFRLLFNNNYECDKFVYDDYEDNILTYLCRHEYRYHDFIKFIIEETYVDIYYKTKDNVDALKLLSVRAFTDSNIELLINKGIMDKYSNDEKLNIFTVLMNRKRDEKLINLFLLNINLEKYEFSKMKLEYYSDNIIKKIIIKFLEDNNLIKIKSMNYILDNYGNDEYINKLCINKIKENEIYYSILLK